MLTPNAPLTKSDIDTLRAFHTLLKVAMSHAASNMTHDAWIAIEFEFRGKLENIEEFISQEEPNSR